MGQLYSYRGASPQVAPSVLMADSAELVGNVVVGENTLIAGGVRITGDSTGAIRIGARVTILENTVLRPLPDCGLIIEDDVVIGPGAVLQGCHVGSGTVVEAGAVLDGRCRIGAESLVGTGACVKQRSVFPARSVIDGSPAELVGKLRGPLRRPEWAPESGDLAACRTQVAHGYAAQETDPGQR
ncbi:gamma carbonic anhydrase family protein [Streptomyces sp. NPDC059639]|uniref:gamma carbonic anhydrase family protein n=1 Tax=Streptomyces sp. NPDC059639 TaxID=3346891 RepID=UPI0036B7A044